MSGSRDGPAIPLPIPSPCADGLRMEARFWLLAQVGEFGEAGRTPMLSFLTSLPFELRSPFSFTMAALFVLLPQERSTAGPREKNLALTL